MISNNAGVDGFGLCQAPGDAADQEDDLVLCRREQAVRAAIPRRRAGARIQPAGHAGRAHPRRRRRHPGLLHQDRRRHADRRGQGSEGIRRREIRHGARPVRRPRDRPRLEGRHRRQPRLPQDRAQLQPDDGDRREDHRGRGRASGSGRRARSRPHPYPRHFRQTHRRSAAPARSGSSSATPARAPPLKRAHDPEVARFSDRSCAN